MVQELPSSPAPCGTSCDHGATSHQCKLGSLDESGERPGALSYRPFEDGDHAGFIKEKDLTSCFPVTTQRMILVASAREEDG